MHNTKAEGEKKVGVRALKCRSALKSKAFRMKEMMIYLSNSISLLLRLKLPKRKYNIDYIDCQQQQWQNKINSWGSYSIIKWKASSSRLHHTDRLQVCFHGCVFKSASLIIHPHAVCLHSYIKQWNMANVFSLRAGDAVKQTLHSRQTVSTLIERWGHFQWTAAGPYF